MLITFITFDGKKTGFIFPEAEPHPKLIKAAAPLSEEITPAVNEHDRLDLNEREWEPWKKRLDEFIRKKLRDFNKTCRIEYGGVPWGNYVSAD